MEQLELFEVKSPCIGVCQTNNRGYCLGCFRSRQERFAWKDLNNHQKHHIIKLCQQRAQRALKQKNQPMIDGATEQPQQQDLKLSDSE